MTCVLFFCLRQFEYQQAQLELEIENLSWKLERDELYCRGVSILRIQKTQSNSNTAFNVITSTKRALCTLLNYTYVLFPDGTFEVNFVVVLSGQVGQRFAC